MLCDAGGGTVDLISYEITALSPHLELKELVPGKGKSSGLSFLPDCVEEPNSGDRRYGWISRPE